MEDFTLLDNGVPRAVTSFEAIDGQQAQVEVILVIDAVSVGGRELAIAREEVRKFLKADQGHLDFPTTFAILTETGIQFHLGFSRDGKAVSAALDHFKIPQRSIGRGTDRGITAASFQSSLEGFAQLLAEEREKSGRKLVVWISPAGQTAVRGQPTLDAERRQSIFHDAVEISKQVREAQVTLYVVDPSGTADAAPGIDFRSHLRPPDNTAFIAGASPDTAQLSDLELGVIAIESGGLVLHPGNDLASSLQTCVADAAAYYAISFHPGPTDRPDEYHHLEVRVTKPSLTARAIQGYYSESTAFSEKPGKAGSRNVLDLVGREETAPASGSDAIYVHARSYLDWPLAELSELIPDLKTLQPAPDQQQLPVILRNMGRTVDDFVRNIGDLIAREDVTQEKLNADGKTEAKERVRDNYLILHHGYEWGASAEYRMDDQGNRLGPIGLEKGYLVTSGAALSCISFSTAVQPQSRFRYLGDDRLGSQETYVLGFAQKPDEVTFTTVMRGTGGREVDMLTQGILWVDKNSFQILRMRSDLLAPYKEIGLDRLTTDVSFGEVRLQDVPNPLWLPSDVNVYIDIGGKRYRNLHRYTNYRRYRVSVKIGPAQ
jgi:VWFA-related protein